MGQQEQKQAAGTSQPEKKTPPADSIEKQLEALQTTTNGLTSSEAQKRLQQNGRYAELFSLQAAGYQ
ncbi:MAG: cation-transporting P-type ATPase [Chitinophagaceae bacterium]|nr:hypothetical protein [Chitinophagaceae bacterium]